MQLWREESTDGLTARADEPSLRRTAMEFVFVVPRRELFPDHFPQGFTPFGDGYSSAHFDGVVRRHGFFVERARAETNPDWKQVIPYNVVAVGGEVLLLRRTAQGGEARLHDKLTIGVGGHLNPEDLDEHAVVRDPLARGTARELAEELVIDGATTVVPLGLINDDANPVGAVHVGLAQLVLVAGTVEIRETQVLEGRLVGPAELGERLLQGANFETWSARLIERAAAWLPLLSRVPCAAPEHVGAPLGRPSAGARA